jgi:hypothetical protein
MFSAKITKPIENSNTLWSYVQLRSFHVVVEREQSLRAERSLWITKAATPLLTMRSRELSLNIDARNQLVLYLRLTVLAMLAGERPVAIQIHNPTN